MSADRVKFKNSLTDGIETRLWLPLVCVSGARFKVKLIRACDFFCSMAEPLPLSKKRPFSHAPGSSAALHVVLRLFVDAAPDSGLPPTRLLMTSAEDRE